MASVESLTMRQQPLSVNTSTVWEIVVTNVMMAVNELGTELILAALFCAGFMFCRATSVRQLIARMQHRNSLKAKQSNFGGSPSPVGVKAKDMEANWAAGRGDLVLEDWKRVEHYTIGAMKAVVEALVAAGRTNEVPSTLRRIMVEHSDMRTTEALSSSLDALPLGQNYVTLSAEVRRVFHAFLTNHADDSPACTQQVWAALDRGGVEEALRTLTATYSAGRSVSGMCLAAVASELSAKGAAALLRRLPAPALPGSLSAALLEAAVKAGDATLLQEVHEYSLAAGISLPPAAHDALARGYAAAGDSRAMDALDAMVEMGTKPSEATLTAAVSLCAESRHVQMAEHAVACARQAHGRVSLVLYSALIKVYTHARLWAKICDLYGDMRRDGVKPDTVVFGSLIKAAVESGRHELARRLFQESGNPDLLNYMSLIRAAGRERDVPRALRLLDELERSPLAADATAYNCALEACASCGDRSSAEQLLRRMENAGNVDVVSYNTYLKLLLSQGARADADAVLREMGRKQLGPNAVTYNSLIKDAVTRQDIALAWRITGDMEVKGVRPDAFTASILMKGIKHSGSEDVDRILELIQRQGITPDEVLTNCLLDACVRLRDAQRLSRVLEQFKATGVVPSPHALVMLIKAYGHARQPERAWALWRDLNLQAGPAGPSEEAFAALVDACIACGDLPGAAAVFRELSSRLAEFQRAPAVFSALVKACAQCKQARVVVELYSDVKDFFVCGKVTYNTLIDCLVRQGDLVKANELFRDMTLMNVTPDLITYSTMIKGHCSCGDLEQGLMLLGLMQRRGIAPDAVLFNSILDGCAHRQMRMLTEQVLRDMEAAGIAPSNFTLSILVKLYGRCSDLDAAFEVVNTYPERYGFKLNTQVCTCLMSACIANHAMERALDLYDRMGEDGCHPDAKTYQTLLSGCLRHNDLDGALKLMSDALARSASVRLEREVAEGVLMMAVRRGRSDVAMQYLERLKDAGMNFSERVVLAVRRQDGQEAQLRHRQPGVRPVRAGAAQHANNNQRMAM